MAITEYRVNTPTQNCSALHCEQLMFFQTHNANSIIFTFSLFLLTRDSRLRYFTRCGVSKTLASAFLVKSIGYDKEERGGECKESVLKNRFAPFR